MTYRARARRFSGWLAACVLTLAALAGPFAPAARASGTASASGPGWVRLAQLSPGAPAVDIYLSAIGASRAMLVLRSVGYGMVSGYHAVPAGGYTVAMRQAGQPAGTAPVLSDTISVTAGHAYTIASLGPASAPRFQALDDPMSTPKGQALLRIIQASAQQTRVTVTANGHVLVRGLAFGSATSFASLAPGAWNLRAAGPSMSAASRDTLMADTTYTLVVLDQAGHLHLDCLMDEAGSRKRPAGGAEAGFGGTAPRPAPAPLPWLAGMAGGSLMAAGGALWLRRAR